MSTQLLRDRFNTTKEELAKLGSEFNSEALPLLENYTILLSGFYLIKKQPKKLLSKLTLKQLKTVI